MTETDSASAWAQITVVLVTYNSALVIDDCLRSLSAAQNIIVVDNASTDDTCEIITNRFSQVNLLRNSVNKGFGAGVNQGMAEVKTTFALYFSPDAVLMNNAMEILVNTALENPKAGLIGPLLQRPNGETELYVMGPTEIRHSPISCIPDGPFCTWFIMGGVFLTPMSIWREIGGFDEGIFLYSEDTDLSLRITKHGYGMLIAPAARVVHAGGQSSRMTWSVRWRKDWHQIWSSLYVASKHGLSDRVRCEARDIVQKHFFRALLYLFLLRPDRVRGNLAKACGALAFLTGRKGSE
jgi:GT2 family glycosyltransferase